MSAFITLILVVVCGTARILLKNSESLNVAIAVINIMMLCYVFYIVSYKVNKRLKNRADKNTVYRDQYFHFLHAKNGFWIAILLVGLGYILTIGVANSVAISCINDCIAFVTFGLSIEEDRISKKIETYYCTHDFAFRKILDKKEKHQKREIPKS